MSAPVPPETIVTITPYYNIYVSSATILWLSYGIVIALALLGVVSGMLSAYANRGSYTPKFSTILRVARGVSLSASIMITDADGKDPTPAYVEKMVVSFPDGYDPVPVREEDVE